MLILTRKKNETIHIGEGIAVTVIRVSGNKVRLGVSAPRDLRVMRIELDAAPTKRSTPESVCHDNAMRTVRQRREVESPSSGSWDTDGVGVDPPKAA